MADFDSISRQEFLQIADCTVFNLRKATRAASQLFVDALRGTGIRGGQFSILAMTLRHQPVSVKELAENMVMDRTTLTRNLRPLERDGLIQIATGKDRRVREVSLTEEGKAALAAAFPHWREAQTKVIEGLGEGPFRELLDSLRSTVKAVEE